MPKPQNPNKISFGEVFDFLKNNKFFWVMIFITLLMVFVFCGITYFNQQKAIKKHQLLNEHGILILATSYRESCVRIPLRHYRFYINGKTYVKSIRTACGEPLGDSIEVYYLKDKPHINLFKTELQSGVPNYWYSVFMIICCVCLLLFITVYKITHAYLTANKHSQNKLRLRKE